VPFDAGTTNAVSKPTDNPALYDPSFQGLHAQFMAIA